VSSPFLKSLYRSRDPFLVLVYELNALPARILHEEWTAALTRRGVDRKLFDALGASPRGEALLSRLVVKELGGKEAFFDFREPPERVALLEGTALRRLILGAGAAWSSRGISREIHKARVLEIREILGERLYRFAVKTVPLLAPTERLPEAPLPGGPSLEAFLRRGMGCLKSFLPPDLALRMLWKLPRAFAGRWEAAQALPEASRSLAWKLTRKVLLQEIDPSWRPYLS